MMYGQPQQPPAQAQDPQSQYLLQALQSLGKTPQMGNAMGLGSNLLADALTQYGLKRRQAPADTMSADQEQT